MNTPHDIRTPAEQRTDHEAAVRDRQRTEKYELISGEVPTRDSKPNLKRVDGPPKVSLEDRLTSELHRVEEYLLVDSDVADYLISVAVKLTSGESFLCQRESETAPKTKKAK